MNLGVVIVSYNVRDLLRACLDSILADLNRTPDLTATILVVDNASADGSADMVAELFPEVELIVSNDNLGFAGGNNLGLRSLGFDLSPAPPARPDTVVLLNPDTELHPGFFLALTEFFAQNPGAGGCGARLNYGDGSFQHGAFRFPGLIQLFLDLFPLHPRLRETRLNGRYPRHLYETDASFPIDFALGAALAVRREAIDAAGLFDEGYFMYAEEMDWQRRIQAAGWPLYCLPTARVTHHEGQSARQFRSAMTVALWRSRLRYYDKYYPAWKRWAARRLIAAAMRTRARSAENAEQRQTYETIRRLARGA